ncbi:hypothetical protein F4780DRAFT_770413 [Xylariomycetidae sp. FL0641]|nr:hypothetical protein F4780DRAFT_770413 [Xylariomycetidae sp. FL0641]
MRPSYALFTTALLTLAGVAAGQTASATPDQINQFISALPGCALPCLMSAIESSGCGLADIACQCTSPAMVVDAEACVMKSCSLVESLETKNMTQTQCGAPVRDKSTQYTVVSCTMFGVAVLVVLTRISYTQFFQTTGLGLDDLFIILTLLNCVPSAVINVAVLAANGLGRDIWTLTADQITQFAKGFYIITIMYFSEVFVLKLAMLFFYLRIFPGRGIRRLLWATVVFDVLFGLAFVLTAIFQCQPISYNWTNWKGEGGGTCADVSVIAWANAGVSIALDLWMLALPLSQLPQLRLHWKKKVGVGLMFCVGTFVTIVSILRLRSLVVFRESANLTWDYWEVCLWSTIEIMVGIMCACMPALRLILIRLAPKVFDGSVARRATGMYYGRRSKMFQSLDKEMQGSGSDPASSNRRSMRFSLRPSRRLSRHPPSPRELISVDREITPIGHLATYLIR